MELPAWLSALASLTSLCFQVSSLPTGDDNARRLAGLAQLRKLIVWAMCNKEDPLPHGLHGLPRLTELELFVPGLPGNPAVCCVSRLSALRTLSWHPTCAGAAPLPAGILELRSLRSLELICVAPKSMIAGPCWAGLTQLKCEFRPHTPTLPPVLALATALEHLELTGLAGLDAAAPAMLARLPALRRLGLDFAEMTPCAEVLQALGQAFPHVSLYNPWNPEAWAPGDANSWP